MNKSLKTNLAGMIFFGLILGLIFYQPHPVQSGKITIQYWEKWNGFEADAMRAVVDDFNSSQDRIFVDYTSVSNLDRKLMLATAGGVPPDVAGIYSNTLPVYAENNALTPLDAMARKCQIKRESYIDVFWQLCLYRDHLWALPTTPGCLALVWNKKLFREAGLDPNQPPRSIAELEHDNELLTKRAPDGSLIAIGHMPDEPGWYPSFWGFWFGGELWNGKDEITANSPENVAAYQWVESYPKRFGADKLLALRDEFGNFASAQNPFFTGRVAMILQGPWIYNFIKNYAPADFEWGVAAFPSVDPDRLKDVTAVECDALVIPHGARHPDEAFEFIKYVNSQMPMEKLCLGQRKFSPLREISPDFYKNNPNPHIAEFEALAQSPNAHFAPQLTTWNEYADDMRNAVTQISDGKETAEEALGEVQAREQGNLDRRIARWNRQAQVMTTEWNAP